MTAAYSIWGQVGNAAYAVPMTQLTPTDPINQGYVLAWDTANQGVSYFPLAFDPSTFDMTGSGNMNVVAGKVYKVNNVQVVAARRTGWEAATGTTTRTTFATGSVTVSQLAERVKALLDDLTTHGLIGA